MSPSPRRLEKQRQLAERLGVIPAVGDGQALDQFEANDALDLLRYVQRRTLALMAQADRAGDRAAFLRAVREARANLELIGEFTGELNRRGGNTAIAVASSKSTVESQLAALTDEELLEELEAAVAAVRAKVAEKGAAQSAALTSGRADTGWTANDPAKGSGTPQTSATGQHGPSRKGTEGP